LIPCVVICRAASASQPRIMPTSESPMFDTINGVIAPPIAPTQTPATKYMAMPPQNEVWIASNGFSRLARYNTRAITENPSPTLKPMRMPRWTFARNDDLVHVISHHRSSGSLRVPHHVSPILLYKHDSLRSECKASELGTNEVLSDLARK